MSRHRFLKMLTGTRADEDESYDNVIICMTVSTVLMVITSIMEAITYFLYNNKVQSTKNALKVKGQNVLNKYRVSQKKRSLVVFYWL